MQWHSRYDCRLRKSTKSSTSRVADEGKTIKRRHSSIRDKNLCFVQIKVSQLVNGTEVTIERSNDHVHDHDIEESFQLKKPSILIDLIKSESAKHYSSSQIYHAFRGSGSYKH